MKRYYLAYGSNLNVEQMAWRCPDARALGTAEIVGYRLLFKGSKTGAYLTIEPQEGAKVPVAVWEVSAADEARLDRYEGFPTFYYKKDLEITYTSLRTGRKRKVHAFVYIMHEERSCGRPSRQYVLTCLDGYRDFELDERFLTRALLDTTRRNAEGQSMKTETNETRICPLCGKSYTGHPALSRTDNETMICPDCGTRQALDSIGVDPEEQEKSWQRSTGPWLDPP